MRTYSDLNIAKNVGEYNSNLLYTGTFFYHLFFVLIILYVSFRPDETNEK